MTKDELKALCIALQDSGQFNKYARWLDEVDQRIITDIKNEIVRQANANTKFVQEAEAANRIEAEKAIAPFLPLFDTPPKLVQKGETSVSNTFFELLDEDGWTILSINCTYKATNPVAVQWKELYRYAKKTHNDKVQAWVMAQNLGSKIKE